MRLYETIVVAAALLLAHNAAASSEPDDGVWKKFDPTFAFDHDPFFVDRTLELEPSSFLDIFPDRELSTLYPFYHLDMVYAHYTYQDRPNQTIDGVINGNNWTVDVTFLQCQNLTIKDLRLNYKLVSQELLTMSLKSAKFDFNCSIDYQYRYLEFSGAGRADGATESASANLTAGFTSNSDGFNKVGPTGFRVESCNASVDFQTLSLTSDDGDNVVDLEHAAETQLLGFLKLRTQRFVCKALNKSLTVTMADFLKNFAIFVNDTFEGTEEELVNSAEASLPSNVTFMEFANPKGSLDTVVEFLVEEVTSYLASNSTSNASDLNINDLMRSYVLDGNRSLSLNASFLYDLFDGSLTNGDGPFSWSWLGPLTMEISGLDSFTSFSSFQPVGNHTFQANFSLDSASLFVSLLWVVQDYLTEPLTVQIDCGQINVSTDVLIAIDEDILGSLPMASLLNSRDVLDCLLAALHDIQIASLSIHVKEIELPQIGGFPQSPGSKLIASTFMNAVYDMVHYVGLKALPTFFQKTGRELLTNLTGIIIGDATCRSPSLVGYANRTVDLSDLFLPSDEAKAFGGRGTSPYGDVASSIKELIDSLLVDVDNSTGLPGINDVLLGPLTEQQSGVEGTFANLFSFDEKLDAEDSLSARIRIKLSDLNITNIAMGEPFFLLEPVLNESYVLNNTATIGVNDSQAVEVSATIFFRWDGDDGLQIEDNVTIGIGIYRANIFAAVVLKLVEDRLLTFPLKDAFNVQCWLATMAAPTLDARGLRVVGTDPTTGLKSLNISTDFIKFSIVCHACTEASVFKAWNDALGSLEGSNGASHAMNTLIQFVTKVINSGVIQLYLDRLIVQAPLKCPHSPSFNESGKQPKFAPLTGSRDRDSIRFMVGLLSLTVGLIVAGIVVSLAVRFVVRRRHRNWLQTLPPDQVLLVYKQQCLERRKTAMINEVAHSMFRSTEIPTFARYIVPVIVFLNIGVFLSGHLNVAGSVEIRAEVAGQDIRVEDFYKFSVILSARDLWNSGGRLPACMIFLFSVIWPYTKQLVTLALWFLPTNLAPLPIRGFFFRLLDLLAKWSVIDIFFFIIALVAFRVSFASANVSYLPPDLYHADLYLLPHWGLYANLIAQLISQVSAHFILNYHRRTVKYAKIEVERQEHERSNNGDDNSKDPSPKSEALGSDHVGGQPEKLCDFGFTCSDRNDSGTLKVRRWVPPLLYLVTAVVCVAIIAGCIYPSFAFSTQGLVNLVIEAGQGFRPVQYDRSIFDMARLLVEESQLLGTSKARVGLGSLAVLLVLNTLIVPIIHVLLVVAQFVLPLSPGARTKLEAAVEISEDWQYLDVYVVSILISLSQLGIFSESLVNPFCKSFDGFLSDLAHFGILKETDALCFRVQAEVDSGGYILLGAAALTTVMYTFVAKAFRQYHRDREATTFVSPQALNLSTNEEDVDKARQLIQPDPVVFTDTFRWLLVPEISEKAAYNVIETGVGVEKAISDDGPSHQSDEKAILDDLPPQ